MSKYAASSSSAEHNRSLLDTNLSKNKTLKTELLRPTATFTYVLNKDQLLYINLCLFYFAEFISIL